MKPPILWTLMKGIGLFLVTLSACNNQPAPKPPRIPTPLDLSTAGTVSGQVRFEGPLPEQTTLQLGGWSECAVQHPDGLPKAAEVLVREGKLQSAVVYITQGLGDRVFTVPKEPVLSDQHGCIFQPRILTARVDQPIRFLNSDPIAHNVHGLPQLVRPWNFSLGVKGAAKTIMIETPEHMIPVKCDIHGWMHAYIGVFDHPYFAVTDAGGDFSLSNIPPGNYTIEAWHERFGTQRQDVGLGEREKQEIVFTFTAG